ncbi:MAG TPA: DUF2785 domain-containing protein [Candidatus Dormibacteraeota bacterium]|nr:DUF2785 domain-containing protein [Candidatus Dormibacteraeota bacterium]
MSNLPTASLLALLSSPDPHERDEVAYSELARRISVGDEDHALARLGDLMAARFSDPEIQARSFAALILAEVVDRDRITTLAGQCSVTRWRDAFAAWYESEEDLRGWDDRLGWLHALAHGADALGAFGRSPRLGPDDLTGLLALGRDRLLTDTDVVFANQEDDRLAYAIALVLTRQELEAHQVTGWLERVSERFAASEAGPVPAWASNTMRTLRMLYVMADRGVRLPDTKAGGPIVAIRHGIDLRTALADVLRLSWPYLG